MAISWRQRRQLFYTSLVVLFFLCIAVIVYFVYFNRQPTCRDGLQNGIETGVDCGGICPLACREAVVQPIVRYERLLPIDTGFWTAVASVENPNANVGARNIAYIFKVYDARGAAIAERRGTISIPPQTVLPIFSGVIPLGDSVPVRVGFTMEEPESYPVMQALPVVFIPRETKINATDVPPSLQSKIFNTSTVYQTKQTTAVGLLFDEKNNVVGVSQTIVPPISPSGSVDVSFVWRKAFASTPVRAEVVPYPLW